MAFFKRALLTALFAAVSTTATGGLEDSYFAPDGPTLFKAVMPDGSAYRFEYDAQRPGHLLSAIGWTGAYDGKGNVTLQSGTGDELGFQQGRLVSAKLGGKAFSYAYDMPRHAPTNAVTPLAILLYDEKKFSENYLKREESVKWVDSGRLAFPYVNPNFSGALFAQLALLFGALALLPLRRRGVRLLFLALAAVAAGCTAWSGSRGALLGLFAGSGLAAAAVFPWRRATWRTWAAVAGVALAVLGLVLALGSENLMRGFDGQGLAWSNALRVEMTKAAPRMMADAPGGWTSFGVGKGYTFWYQPLGMVLMSGSMINSHLTCLVGAGTVGRFLYLLVLFFLLALSARAAFCGKQPLPLAVLAGFAAMAMFNPLFSEWGLWVVPFLSAVWLAVQVRRTPLRMWAALAGCSVLLAAAVMGVFAYVAGTDGRRPSIRYDGRRVRVNGESPRIWIVDDGQGALGGVLVGREIREFYALSPHAPSVGYVRSIDDLPEKGVERLVLPGKSGNDWLLRLSEDERMRSRLPKSVLFVSPPFSPSEVPEGVVALCNPTVVVGEFAARYNDEYRTPRKWVRIVPGMEKYVMRWMALAVGE